MNLVDFFLGKLKVKHSRFFVDENYQNAPDSNNMLGIQRILSRYGIKTIGVHFRNKEEACLTFPCILHGESSFLVGIDLDDDNIKYYDGERYIIEETSLFKERWTGDALFVTDKENAKEPSYSKNKVIDFYNVFGYYFFFVMIFALGIGSIIHNGIIIPQAINMLLDLSGFFVCFLLFQKQQHSQNAIAERVCSMFQKGGCDSVLDSTDSKIFGIVSWTEVGLAYFSSRVLFCSLSENSLVVLQLVGWIAMVYGIWSIWYQLYKIKRWCTLCCLTQIIVWTSGIYNSFFIIQQSIPIKDIVTYLIFGLFTLGIVQNLFRLCSIYELYTKTKKEFLNLKLNEKILEVALSESNYIDVRKEDSSIVYGNPDAHITLTVLTNPLCRPCERMHKKLTQLVTNNSDVNIQYIYSSFNKGVEDFSLFCIAVYQQMPYNEAVKILDKWYQYGKYKREQFIKDIGVNIKNPDVLKEYAKHIAWKNRTGIESTPTVIYKGHIIPNYYDPKDFIYLDIESVSSSKHVAGWN